MARSSFPHALKMRTLKYGEATEEERTRVAEALRSAGRYSESLLLYERRPGHADLRLEAEWAIAHGNGFHLVGVRRAGGDVDEQAFRACAAKAESLGRFMDARHCYVAIGDEAAVRAIAEHLPEALQPEPDAEPEGDA